MNRAELNEGSCSWGGEGVQKPTTEELEFFYKNAPKIRMVLLHLRGLGDHLYVLHVVQNFYPHENCFSLLHPGI